MVSSPPRLAGGGGEGEATSTEQAASPSPALQPKSDLSDFGRLMVPKSGKPDFGCKRGRGRMRPAHLTSPASPVGRERKRAPCPSRRAVLRDPRPEESMARP